MIAQQLGWPALGTGARPLSRRILVSAAKKGFGPAKKVQVGGRLVRRRGGTIWGWVSPWLWTRAQSTWDCRAGIGRAPAVPRRAATAPRAERRTRCAGSGGTWRQASEPRPNFPTHLTRHGLQDADRKRAPDGRAVRGARPAAPVGPQRVPGALTDVSLRRVDELQDATK